MVKTYLDWELSKKNINDFLKGGDLITHQFAGYIRDLVTPEFCLKGILQEGEPTSQDTHTGNLLYMTFVESKDRLTWRYIGLIPSVNVEKFQCSSCGYEYITCACETICF